MTPWKTTSRFTLLSILALTTCLSLNGCGAGSSTAAGGGSGGGGGGLGPNPEPINEFPATVPSSFQATACPDPNDGNTDLDLRIEITSPTATNVDLNGDTVDDATLLDAFDTSPQSLFLQVWSILGTPYPPANINFALSHTFLSGYESGADNRLKDPMLHSFPGFATLLNGSWTGDFANPILEQQYIPGTTIQGSNAPVFPDYGFEGFNTFLVNPNPQCDQFINLCPGVHVVVARFYDTGGRRHCTEVPWRIVVCPVQGVCN